MTNKIKSLIYLSCFIVAAVLYNNTIEETSVQLAKKMELTKTNTIAESHSEDLKSSTLN